MDSRVRGNDGKGNDGEGGNPSIRHSGESRNPSDALTHGIESPPSRHSRESGSPSGLQSGDSVNAPGRHSGESAEPVELLFSEQFACVHCGISLGEVEPRTFSFNSPHGACPDCTGIGTTMVFDPDLIVPNKRLSPLEGAILPWSRLASKDSYLYQVVKAVAAHYGFSCARR